MKLNYNGQEKVKAPPAAVWAFVQDPARVARCLPEVQDVQVTGPNQLVATVNISKGMLRAKLKFDINVKPDPDSGRVNVTIKGGGLGNAVDVTAGADIKDAGDGTTTLDWQGEADMRGPLVNMGGRVMEGEIEKMIGRTFQNMGSMIASENNKLA